MDITADTELQAEPSDPGCRAEAPAFGSLADTLDFSLFEGVRLSPGARDIAERIYAELLPQLRAEQGSDVSVSAAVRLDGGQGGSRRTTSPRAIRLAACLRPPRR